MTTTRSVFMAASVIAFTFAPAAIATTLELWANDEPFSGIYLEGKSGSRVGTILLPGRGLEPDDWVTQELRTHLSSLGYATLAIQNPLPSGGTGFSDYVADEDVIDDKVFARVEAATSALTSRHVDNIVLVGFSLGSRFATAAAAAWEQGLLETSGANLVGLIGIGMYVGRGGSTPTPDALTSTKDINVLDTRENLEFLSVPVLDLYGSGDTSAFLLNGLNVAAQRVQKYGGEPTAYTQLPLATPGAGYSAYYEGTFYDYQSSEFFAHGLFNGYESGNLDPFGPDFILRGLPTAPLEDSVTAWMATNAPLQTVPLPAAAWLLGAAVLVLGAMGGRRSPREMHGGTGQQVRTGELVVEHSNFDRFTRPSAR